MPTLAPAELLDWLGQWQFLSPQQLEPLRANISNFSDSHALARELIQRNWLTPFQINQILQGKRDQLVLDSYRLTERIGEGAMGQVFKAWQPRMDRTVAIKMILKELVGSSKALERFRREADAAGQLEHPNIARVRDAGAVNGRPYLVMDFIDGFNLSTQVKQHGPLPIHEAVEYVRQAALGLQHAHEHGIVHRDIKPGNLLVTMVKSNGGTRPLVKILDFGLARLKGEEDDSARLTEVGKLLGTIDYIAPEQAHDARGADIRSDIYSLGCTLFFLLTARPAFLGENVVEKLGPRLTGEAPWVRAERPEVAPALEEVLRKMMARRPEDRYQTPLEAALALMPFTAPIPVAQPVSGPATGPIPMAMPVPTDASVPAPPLAQPAAAPEADPSFLGMTASGRELSTGAAASKTPTPAPRQGAPSKLLAILGGVACLAVLIGCMACVLSWLFRGDDKKMVGEIVITKARYANPRNESKPGINRLHITIDRVKYSGAILATLKDLPPGVSVDPVTVPPKKNPFELSYTVSFGTPPQVKQIRIYLESVPPGIHTEMPMTLTVIDDPNRIKK